MTERQEVVKDEGAWIKRYCEDCHTKFKAGNDLHRIPRDDKPDKMLCPKCFDKAKKDVVGKCRQCMKLQQPLKQSKVGRWVCPECLAKDN